MSKRNDNQEHFELFLPVFKQGDDLQHHLKHNPDNPSQAFLDLAEQYEIAGEICRRVASTVVEAKHPVSVYADTHYISITAAKEDFAGLLQDEVVTVPERDDEDYDDEELDESFEDETLEDVEE